MTPGDVAAVDARAHEVEQAINGTLAQRRDAHFLLYVADQARIERCFDEREQSYHVPPDTSLWAGRLGVPGPAMNDAVAGTNVDALTRSAFHYSERLEILGAAIRTLNAPAVLDSGYQEALAMCASGTTAPELPDVGNSDVAARFESLLREATVASDALGTSEASMDAPAGVPGYAACVARDGFTASTQTELDVVVGERFSVFEVPSGPPVGTGKAWQDATAFEARAAAADARCRQGPHSRLAAELGPALERFEAENLTELRRVQEQWVAVSDRAAEARGSWYAKHPSLKLPATAN